jgi:hypothetical protein
MNVEIAPKFQAPVFMGDFIEMCFVILFYAQKQ